MIKMLDSLLIIEDNVADYEIILYGLKESGYLPNVSHFETGEEAIEFLQSQSSKQKLPSLILLDLKLPGIDGKEVLKKIKSLKNTHKIPVIILTTSDYEQDVKDCYEFGANAYLQKPTHLADFVTLMKSVHDFWMEGTILPRQ